ncbi:hypothetical protein [Streptomyces sp. NBC_00690]|uniref:hypothetical protein n=1 Tax=Streptomyces sp. NBC_00690 TaxID=2975808 RepID=UPI002E286603|nr:hypothetical protein [Streptomyces sp. NBC_00690]
MNISELVTAEPDGASFRQLRIRGHLLKVVTTSPEADALVSETFWPPGMLGVFDTPPGSTHRPDLTVVDLPSSPTDIHALLRLAADNCVPGEFELTRDYRLPRYDADTHTVFTLRDVNSDEVAALVRTEDRAVIVRPRSGLGDRWLTRIIRDVATRIAKAEGSLVLHSSALVFDDGAYLVVGDSGAGKSTTAIALARLLPEAGWMGNDRMHLDRRGHSYDVTACPLPLAINKGSLDVMGVSDFDGWPVRAGLPGVGSDWDQFQGEDKLKLSSREVHRFLGVDVVPQAPLAGVILPRIDREAAYRLEPSTLDHTSEVIRRNCFSLDDNLYGEDWLKVPVRHHAPPPSVEDFLEHLAKLPVLRCSLGSAADVARLADEFARAVRL